MELTKRSLALMDVLHVFLKESHLKEDAHIHTLEMAVKEEIKRGRMFNLIYSTDTSIVMERHMTKYSTFRIYDAT